MNDLQGIGSARFDLEMEAYAVARCGNDLQNVTDFVAKTDSVDACCTDGRVHYFRNDSLKLCTISFRGSQSAVNFLNDAWVGCTTDLKRIADLENKIPEAYRKFEMHRGFSYEYSALRKAVQSQLEDASFFPRHDRSWRLLITGHSLGGALATLCVAQAMMTKLVSADRIALITFGSPRVVNYDFAQWIDQQGLQINARVEFGDDIVTSVPAQNCGAFWHRGRSIRLGGNSSRRVASVFGEENGICRKIGNTVSQLFRVFDPLDPAISRLATSILGVAIDLTSSIPTVVQGKIPIVDQLQDHGRYWDFASYLRLECDRVNRESLVKIGLPANVITLITGFVQ